jgi:hypothetical protein
VTPRLQRQKKWPALVVTLVMMTGAPAMAADEFVQPRKLMDACQYDEARRDDPQAMLVCAQECWQAATIAGTKATALRTRYRLALGLSALLLSLVGASLLVFVARKAGHDCWSESRSTSSMAATCAALFVAGLFVASGARSLAGGEAEEALQKDACAFKRAEVAGAAWFNGVRMTCNHAGIRDRVIEEGRRNPSLYAAFASFRGVTKTLAEVNTNVAPDGQTASLRFDQFSRLLTAADRLDPGTQCGADAEVTTSAGPVGLVRDATPFPGGPLAASAFGLVLASIFFFLWRRIAP